MEPCPKHPLDLLPAERCLRCAAERSARNRPAQRALAAHLAEGNLTDDVGAKAVRGRRPASQHKAIRRAR